MTIERKSKGRSLIRWRTVHRIHGEKKSLPLRILEEGLPDEQPGKTDLSRRNSRKGGFPDKQASSLANGSCHEQPLKNKTKFKKAKLRTPHRKEEVKRSKRSPNSVISASSTAGRSFSSSSSSCSGSSLDSSSSLSPK